MKKSVIIGIVFAMCMIMTVGLLACGLQPAQTNDTPTQESKEESTGNPIVQFTFSTGDIITVELYPDKAPITVNNFLTYVNEGFYKGTVIHRVESYVVQGGGYVIKNYAYTKKEATHPAIKGEFASNGVNNPVSHTAGVISMARIPSSPDSASTEFFFCPIDMLQFDGDYAAFGHVVDDSSLAAIQRLSQVDAKDTYPTSAIVINSVKVLEK